MKNIIHRKQRIFDDPLSSEDSLKFAKNNLVNTELHLKNVLDKVNFKIIEFLDDNSIMLATDSDFMPNSNKVIIYGLIDRYIEVEMDIEEIRGPGYLKCKINNLKRAKTVRKELRFKVNREQVVATNFKVSKHTIDISGFNVPTSIKVILDQFHSLNSNLADIVKVDILEPGDIIFEELKKTGETLFIENVSNPESYKALTEDFLDIEKLLGDDIDNYRKKNIERGYKSILISPVIYITENERSIPFAYIQLISKEEVITLEKVLEIKDLTFKLVDRIRDANTLLLSVHQDIVDISKSGAKLKITDEGLKKCLVHSKGFIFDIVFKLQAPITIYGEIKSTFFDDDDNMFIGVDFEGNSSREDEMKRYNSILDPMIKDYKSKLVKELKQKKV